MNKELWLASCCLMIFGLLFLGGGILFQIYQMQKEPLKGRTTARVIDLLLQEPENGARTAGFKNCYYPVLEYYAEGKLFKVTYPFGSYPSPFRINQELRLVYNRSNPEEYRIASFHKWKLKKDSLNHFTHAWQLISDAMYGAGVICISLSCIIFLIFAVRG